MDLSSTAIVFEAPREVTLREIRLPEPGDEDIIIDNVYTGISVGTEGWILRGERDVDTQFPCVPGYQQSGIVTYTGSKVTGIKVGDRVNAFHTRLPDGVNYGWGGHASRSVADCRWVVKIPDGVTLKAASLAKLFAISYNGVCQTEVQPGDLVVVLGMGLIGQGYGQVARMRGARVIGADLVQNRLDLAREYSCDICVLSGELESAVHELNEEGADVVVDTTGKAELIDRCIQLARVGARIVWQGWYPDRVSFDFHPAHCKRVKMIFPCSWEGEEIVLEMLRDKRLMIDPLITHVYAASSAPKAYQMMLESPQDFLGITIKWRDE